MEEYDKKMGSLFEPIEEQILPTTSGNELISDMIESGKPFAASRIGSIELRSVMCNILSLAQPSTILCNNAGVCLPSESEYVEFANLFTKRIADIDLMALWQKDEMSLISKQIISGNLTYLRALEPYYFESPWSSKLEGKKVLIIHPFTETMDKQFNKRELLFSGNILPKFEPIFLKAKQTSGLYNSNWFECLYEMENMISMIDFDVAIIGCGGYGLPLASYIKNMGKQAIHMGGATQILFGIKGRRWDKHDIISKLYNEHWVRPDVTERPSNYLDIEWGCYW